MAAMNKDLMKYFECLIYGYIRQIEKDIELIPDDLKALCMAFCYTFLNCNEYCNVQMQQEQNDQKLIIETKSRDEMKTSEDLE